MEKTLKHRFDFGLITARAAIEIDSYNINKETDFSNIRLLTEIIGENLNESPSYIPLPYTLRCTLFPDLSTNNNPPVSEYFLKLKLFHMELSDVENLSIERLENLSKFICKLSNYYRIICGRFDISFKHSIYVA